MDKMYVSLMVGILSCLVLMGSVNAFTHIVGGSNGWRVPNNVTFFEQWAKPRTFGVGDRLVFPYRPGCNNLLAVNKADFDTCGQEKVINMYFLGPTILNLTQPGDYYYYDGIGKHCEAGQKLHIKVGTTEGSSGSDPMPFNLETFGIHTTLKMGLPNTISAPASAPEALTILATPAPAPGPSSAAAATPLAHKFGLASAPMLIIAMAFSMFL